MKILIKTPTGNTITIEVESYHTIKDIKDKINGQEGISLDEFKLNFEGKELLDGFVSDYKIENESVLSLTNTSNE